MVRLLAGVTALLLQALAARAQAPEPGPRAGETSEIRWESVSSFRSSDGSEGESHSGDMLVERVTWVRDAGVELEFDLRADTSAEDRARSWQFPARVLRPPGGPLQLLNGPEMEGRVDRWLAAGGWTRENCGRWIFTWDAFQIECDPQSVLQTIAAIDLDAAELRDGAPYREPWGRGPAILRREASGPDGAAFAVEMEVDPEAALRERARMDAAAREMVGDSPEFRAIFRARSAERISGTIRIRFETDAAGRARRRTKVIVLEIEGANGQRETRTTTETVERRPFPRRAP
jgi:hypothetical protein